MSKQRTRKFVTKFLGKYVDHCPRPPKLMIAMKTETPKNKIKKIIYNYSTRPVYIKLCRTTYRDQRLHQRLGYMLRPNITASCADAQNIHIKKIKFYFS